MLLIAATFIRIVLFVMKCVVYHFGLRLASEDVYCSSFIKASQTMKS
jgi:hypothetical protein